MLFVPTTGLRGPQSDHQAAAVGRGQLYNLDSDEKIGFQFNPEVFEWTKEWKWAEVSYKGRRYGRDLFFITEEGAEFDLPLLYINDPNAPEFEYPSDYQIRGQNGVINFQEILRLIAVWQSLRPGLGRPSRLMILLGQKILPGGMCPARAIWFETVITKIHSRILETFETGQVREAMIIFSFREWTPHAI